MQPPALPFSVTCETHDEAVVHCLSALSYFAEHFDPGVASGGGPAVPVTSGAPLQTAGWDRDEGRVTFRFSDQRRRGTFLGEATRLLAGKWVRVAMADDQTATA